MEAGLEARIWDVVVVGGGPAGLMAAGQAALRGASTLVLEKKDRPGRKLRITGKGRCNLTNTAQLTDFLTHIRPDGRFLRQAFARFFSRELVDFFHGIGVETMEERGGRVFPVEESAELVTDSLVSWTRRCGAQIQPDFSVTSIRRGETGGFLVKSGRNGQVSAAQVILAVGGASYPGTGSTGDGVTLAGNLGHRVVPLRPALIPLETAGSDAADLQGLSLRNAEVSLVRDGRRVAKEFGELVFTHFGVSGPVILTLSGQAVDALVQGAAVGLSIDLKPALDHEKLDARLLRELEAHNRKQAGSMLKELLPRKLIPVMAARCGIPLDLPCHQINSKLRKQLRCGLKEFTFEVVRARPMAEAIVTAGGVDTREVDPRTMESRLVPGLFFAGEVLDLDGETGGYNLQIAFSTGFLAGRSVSAKDSEEV